MAGFFQGLGALMDDLLLFRLQTTFIHIPHQEKRRRCEDRQDSDGRKNGREPRTSRWQRLGTGCDRLLHSLGGLADSSPQGRREGDQDRTTGGARLIDKFLERFARDFPILRGLHGNHRTHRS